VVGVNTFLSKEGSPFVVPRSLIRSTDEDKDRQIANVRGVQERNRDRASQALDELQRTAISGGNIFAQLMETAKVATLGQMSQALYQVGGQYRRNM
jgi:methylmalonyl-CoA mutase